MVDSKVAANDNTFAFWREQGLGVRAANVLCDLNCHSITDVLRRGREEVFQQRGIGQTTFRQICDLVGWSADNLPTKRIIERRPVEPTPPPARSPVRLLRRPTEQVSLHFRFMLPSLIDMRPVSGVRLKIENAVIYFKPVSSPVGTDVIPITAWQPPRMNTKMEGSHLLFARISTLIKQIGWTAETPYMHLDHAMHGWYAVTTAPTKRAPNGRAHVFVWLLDLARPIAPTKPMTFGPIITADQVAQVLRESNMKI